MWENVIGIVNEQAGTNQGVEALINAPTVGGGRKAAAARRAAAQEAVMATGGFDSAITNYHSLLNLAKTQGAVGAGNRGACKVCGQIGHLTRQCRNQFSKYFDGAEGGEVGPSNAGAPLPGIPDGDLSDSDLSLSHSSKSSSGSESSGAQRKRKEKERKRKRKERREKKEKSKKRRRKEKEARKEGKRDKKHKKKSKRSSSSSSSSGSESD